MYRRVMMMEFKICKKCGKKINHISPDWEVDNDTYCYNCAFKLGLVSEKQYIKDACFWNAFIKRAAINPKTGEIEITDKKFSWEMKSKDYRHNIQYKNWRLSVFKRDNYTCKMCGRCGGDLEAHHIKTFIKYIGLRFAIDNGLTLCKKCHKQIHKKKVKI
jgi:hypothetical protein